MSAPIVSSGEKRTALLLRGCLAAVIAFFSLTIAAMLLYPGGAESDRQAAAYLFSENFFSDLGQWRTQRGAANLPSAFLFSISLAAVGAGVFTFFNVMARLLAGGRRFAPLALRISSAIAGAACVGVAFTPWDLLPQPHTVCVYTFAVGFLVSLVIQVVLSLRAPGYTRAFPVSGFGYGLILAAFIALMWTRPDLSTREGVALLALGQKITIYSGIVFLLIQIIGALRYIKSQHF